MEQKAAESKFAVAVSFVNMRKQSARIGGAQSEDEAKALVDSTISVLRSGSGVRGHLPSEVYSVFAYAILPDGMPGDLVKQTLVRERPSVEQETAVAA